MIFAQPPIDEPVLIFLRGLFKVRTFIFPEHHPEPWEDAEDLPWEVFRGRGITLMVYLLGTFRPVLAHHMLRVILYSERRGRRR